MAAANDNSPKRLMTRPEAAAYCGAGVATFTKWVEAGLLPPALVGLKRWDRLAIDAHLNKASGIGAEAEPEDEFDKWKRERDAAKAARRGTGH
ncbi:MULTISPECIES: hypothetical protein [unclassified Chelatococcus]|uniref:helix-turn-helix transcriptional regulator n=1 Tax=unclassified Chelatococcus TaxID=2638111 RepID=UPI001BCB35B5|nr:MULTISPECIES: hypothetical protein [unclassified Chelatococcus]MBS7737914.1 helix-turn-helix domain-containing protein [Chelatococcus sp. HY11]MCO5079368.1 helix-turn-helix domain-containing protein [Chelatococcus sp.]